MTRLRFKQMITRCFIVCAVVTACHSPATAGMMHFLDWTASFSGGVQHFDNTSSAGTINGTSACPGCWGGPTGTYGVANAIDPPGPITFTTEFSAFSVGSSVNFTFSNNFGWGTGGELILGNIHEYFEYTLSAWDFGGNPINVNTQWTFLAEYPQGSPGQMGYFSTSSTGHCAGTSTSGNPPGQSVCPGTAASESFFVYDTGADANSGQGGVLLLGGLQNVGRIQLTLASNNLAANGHGSDFLLFNVGTPVPEPSSALLIGASGIVGVLVLRRRRKRSGTRSHSEHHLMMTLPIIEPTPTAERAAREESEYPASAVDQSNGCIRG
jgi:PEP-CTERM motif